MVVNPEDRFSHVGDVNRPIMYSFIKAIVISVIQFFFCFFFSCYYFKVSNVVNSYTINIVSPCLFR